MREIDWLIDWLRALLHKDSDFRQELILRTCSWERERGEGGGVRWEGGYPEEVESNTHCVKLSYSWNKNLNKQMQTPQSWWNPDVQVCNERTTCGKQAQCFEVVFRCVLFVIKTSGTSFHLGQLPRSMWCSEWEQKGTRCVWVVVQRATRSYVIYISEWSFTLSIWYSNYS